MTRRSLIVMLVTLTGVASNAQADLTKGIESFEQHRWTEAMGEFLDVLRQDPRNAQAHQYIVLTVQQIDAEKRVAVRDRRILLLGETSKRLESNRLDATALQTAITENTQAEEKIRQERRHAQCVMAEMEDRRGNLTAANDYVLRVLAEDSSNVEAQRLLSDLQSQIHEMLDTASLSAPERFALEGFYAYSQADYRTALSAWTKAHATLLEAFKPEEAKQQEANFHFGAYEPIAQAHVDEVDRADRALALFTRGTVLYKKGLYVEARENFRQVALINPNYPQLGGYLVQSEAAAEKERTSRLSQKIKDQSNEAFVKGLTALENGRYSEARAAFQEVLKEDPTHPQAKSYLAVVETEMNRRHDPQAAQVHYESGLIAYASGNLDEAVREWNIATSLDPENQKASNALSKVQKELALYKEVPG